MPGILREVLAAEGLQQLPLFALGASSGGSLVLRLAAIMGEVQASRAVRAAEVGAVCQATAMLLAPAALTVVSTEELPHVPPTTTILTQGVTSQITPVNPSTLAVEGGRRAFPPTLFVHMAQRDPDKAETVAAAMEILGCVLACACCASAQASRTAPRAAWGCVPRLTQHAGAVPQGSRHSRRRDPGGAAAGDPAAAAAIAPDQRQAGRSDCGGAAGRWPAG